MKQITQAHADAVTAIALENLSMQREIQELRMENDRLKIGIALWDATFSKYLSWKANGADSNFWPHNVVKDYQTCEMATKGLWKETKADTTPQRSASD